MCCGTIRAEARGTDDLCNHGNRQGGATVNHRFIKGNLTGGVALDALRTFLTVSFPISTVSPGEIKVAVVVAVGTQ